MVGDSLQNVLATLKSERTRIDGAIAAIESLIAGAPVPVKRKRGRPPGSGKKATAGAAPAAPAAKAQKRAPRGLLKKLMHEVLGKAKKPLAPFQLRDAVIAAGYPVKDKTVLYTTVFATAKADPKIRKTKEGFSLR